MNHRPLAALAASTFFLLSAQAQTSPQTQAAGLWEHTFSITSQGGEVEAAMAMAQKQLESLPPDQRKRIEDAMASRGVKFGAQGTTAKYCVTPAQATRPPEPHLTENCSRQDMTRNGNTIKFKFECSKPQPLSGEGEMSYLNDKSYRGTSTVSTQIAGRPQQMTMDMRGRWLSADCGDIKPMTVPQK